MLCFGLTEITEHIYIARVDSMLPTYKYTLAALLRLFHVKKNLMRR